MTKNKSTDESQDSAPHLSGRLGERLMERGILSLRQFQFAMQKQSVEKLRLGLLLIRYGLVREDVLVRELAARKSIPFLTADLFPLPDADVLRQFNRELCLLKGFLPIKREGDELEVLLGDGDEASVSELVMHRTGLKCRFLQGAFSRVSQHIRESYYFTQNSIESLVNQELRRLSADADHAISPDKCLDYLLHWAVHERATDIHLTPSATSLHLFFRIDGVLRPMIALPLALRRLIVFIKL
ncbi:MAG: secretion system protein, partial [Candidatus Accumulibacter sp.]|nr:secretion system protein [Accumulibacter sp.]